MKAPQLLDQLRSVVESGDDRESKARRIAELIRNAGDYRWVGIYDVHPREIAIIAWSGPGAPAYPRFPVEQGLSGSAVRFRATVIVNDVTQDARYLTTFGGPRSEMVVPVLDPSTRSAWALSMWRVRTLTHSAMKIGPCTSSAPRCCHLSTPTDLRVNAAANNRERVLSPVPWPAGLPNS